MEVSGELKALSASPPGKELRNPLNRKLRGTHSCLKELNIKNLILSEIKQI
jgi:hypothetical protein